ncbi:4-(cytidine 5'-diphospho)-2-C-methyl-D-erythritol kinase [bacterium]|nr:4-(cytidine 5'-diphospho)-2-C-methyl-D-erythritol kinase [bacterium]
MLRQIAPERWIAQAPAKVNLFLRVVARRPDGYHDIETVMLKVPDLADSLEFTPRTGGQVALSVRLAYPQALGALAVPVTEDNLVLRAVRMLQTLSGCRKGVQICLTKRIPPAAGLGGGSSDAATTLIALNQLWGLSLPLESLLTLAAELGSDVPFFIANAACQLGTGRGEELHSVAVRASLPLVLARPHSGLSTPAVYRSCVPEPEGPTAQAVIELLGRAGLSPLARRLHNSLQPPAEQLNPEVVALLQRFQRQGVVTQQMTGSGSACFALCHSLRQARVVAGRLRASGVPWVWITSTAV